MGSRGTWSARRSAAGCLGSRSGNCRAQAAVARRDLFGSCGRDGRRGHERGAIAMSPAQAMLWQVCRRHRWGLVADGAYLLVAAVAIRLLPAEFLQIKDNTGAPQIAF